jgi:hypothetical protein
MVYTYITAQPQSDVTAVKLIIWANYLHTVLKAVNIPIKSNNTAKEMSYL